MASKISGTKLTTFHGLDIYGEFTPPKRGGKATIWIQIRQDKPKRFRVRESLSYARSVDIEFAEDPE